MQKNWYHCTERTHITLYGGWAFKFRRLTALLQWQEGVGIDAKNLQAQGSEHDGQFKYTGGKSAKNDTNGYSAALRQRKSIK